MSLLDQAKELAAMAEALAPQHPEHVRNALHNAEHALDHATGAQ